MLKRLSKLGQVVTIPPGPLPVFSLSSHNTVRIPNSFIRGSRETLHMEDLGAWQKLTGF